MRKALPTIASAATIGVLLSLAKPASAAIITYNFRNTVSPTTTPFTFTWGPSATSVVGTGEIYGSFTIDNTALANNPGNYTVTGQSITVTNSPYNSSPELFTTVSFAGTGASANSVIVISNNVRKFYMAVPTPAVWSANTIVPSNTSATGFCSVVGNNQLGAQNCTATGVGGTNTRIYATTSAGSALTVPSPAIGLGLAPLLVSAIKRRKKALA